jgi:hypothetical protein
MSELIVNLKGKLFSYADDGIILGKKNEIKVLWGK